MGLHAPFPLSLPWSAYLYLCPQEQAHVKEAFNECVRLNYEPWKWQGFWLGTQ